MESKSGDFARIGRSLIIKGDLSGSEDLYIDGEIEGTIELQGNGLIIGPNGQVRANVNAKTVVVHGKINGNIRSSDRTELRKSAVATGDVYTQRISIEDGAYFKGKVEIQKQGAAEASSETAAKMQPKAEIKVPETSVPVATGTSGAASSTPNVTSNKTGVTEVKKF